ncbi:MAG: hypothetical protein AAF197_04355 [Pseudomonadota bacterium]
MVKQFLAKQRPLLLVFLAGWAMWGNAHLSFAESATDLGLPVSVNAAKPLGTNRYEISGNDDFFVFRSDDLGVEDSRLSLPFYFERLGQNEEVMITLFFQGRKIAERFRFSSSAKAVFNFAAQEDGSMTVSLPSTVLDSLGEFVRIDVDHCNACQLSLGQNQRGSANVIKGDMTLLRTGENALAKTEVIQLNDQWSRNAISETGEVLGADPYLVSPYLDVATDNLAGVYLELMQSDAEYSEHNLQFFYATEGHGFVEAASTIFRVKTQDGVTAKVFLNLDFLASGNPSRATIERIRLDFDGAGGNWQLLAVEMVALQDRGDYQAYRPAKLRVSKMQTPSKADLVNGIWSRLTADPVFLLLYLFGILGVAVFTLRGWRKAS